MSDIFLAGRVGGSDARKEPRASVIWRGRVQLPGGHTVDVRIRDISNSGAGFLSPEPMPMQVPLMLTLEVPTPEDLKRAYMVTTQFMAANVVLQGHDYRIGTTWTLEPATRELIKHWVLKILYG